MIDYFRLTMTLMDIMQNKGSNMSNICNMRLLTGQKVKVLWSPLSLLFCTVCKLLPLLPFPNLDVEIWVLHI